MIKGQNDQGSEVGGGADQLADRRLQQLLELHDRARSTHDPRLELYHRDVYTVRARKTGDGPTSVTVGHESGLAVRTRTEAGIGFAACSGPDADSSDWTLRQSAAWPADPTPEDAGSWPEGSGSALIDRDRVLEPTGPGLSSWLESAWGVLLASPYAERVAPREAVVEASRIIETLVADDDLRASRVRTRGWTLLRPTAAGWSRPAERPVLAARRRWRDLPHTCWLDVLEDRVLFDEFPSRPVTGGRTLLLAPEPASVLVEALVRALSIVGHPSKTPVGAAFEVTDAPTDPDSIFGGKFDDAGFSTRERQLADGACVTARVEGRGHFRRSSFRDRPLALPSNLIVTSKPESPPTQGVLATTLRMHVLSPDRWILEIEGAELSDGLPGAPLRATVSTGPLQLARHCVAAVGPARAFHRGVTTPALVFDGLTLEP